MWLLRGFGIIDKRLTLMLRFLINPLAPTYSSISLPQCYRRAELEKRRSYEERIREIEHGSFTPLVFSCSGGMGPLATLVYKRLASLISEKSSQTYSMTLYWLRCKLSFSLLRTFSNYLFEGLQVFLPSFQVF